MNNAIIKNLLTDKICMNCGSFGSWNKFDNKIWCRIHGTLLENNGNGTCEYWNKNETRLGVSVRGFGTIGQEFVS
jgi:hypothetical protein